MRLRSTCLVLALAAAAVRAEGDIALPDAPAATAEFAKARSAAEQARWDEAVAGYQALLEQKGPVEGVVQVNEVFALGWREAARRALLALPPEGRAAYQALVGAKAPEALAAAAGNPDALWEVVRLYPASDAAWEARRLLAAEGAHPREAIRVLEDLLDYDPSPTRDAPATAMRIAEIAASLGETGRILFLARRAKKEWPEAKVTVDGREIPIEEALRAKAASTKPEPRKDWPRWGGGLDGEGVFPEVPPVGRYLWSQEVNEGEPLGDNAVQARGMGGPGPASDPVVASERLFLIAGDTVLCKDLARGNHVWSYRVPQAAAQAAAMIWIQREMGGAEPKPTAPCVHDGLLAFEYGRDRGRDTEGRGGRPMPRFSEVHVLDAANGKRLWSWSTDKDEALKGKASLSCPILTPEGLYTIAMVNNEGARTATLLAFDRESGDGGPRWRRLLSTVPSGASPWSVFQRDPDAILACSDGAVVVATNLGVVAAVDAASGDLLWTYAYGAPAAGGPVNAPNNPLESRRTNPPGSWAIAADGVVLFSAADTPCAWAISPRAGKKLWNNPVSTGMHPAGYGQGTLFVSGSEMYVVDVATGKRVWFQIPGTYARAAVAGNGCLCWGNGSLSFRRNEDGEEFDGYDWRPPEEEKNQWPEPSGAILPLGDRILLQARGRLYCFRLEDPVPPPEDLPARIAGWIGDLSSPTYAVRHSAAELLLVAGAAAKPRLEEAAANADREVSWRAREVLKAIENSHLLVRRPPKKQK